MRLQTSAFEVVYISKPLNRGPVSNHPNVGLSDLGISDIGEHAELKNHKVMLIYYQYSSLLFFISSFAQ